MIRAIVCLPLILLACGAPASTPDAGDAVDAGETPDASGDTAEAGTFASMYALFDVRCTGCHSGEPSSGELDLSTPGIAYAQLVDFTSNGPLCGSSPHVRVVPNDPSASLLYTKLNGTFDCGLRMPSGREGPGPGPRPEPFTEEELAIVRAWINAGAPRP